MDRNRSTSKSICISFLIREIEFKSKFNIYLRLHDFKSKYNSGIFLSFSFIFFLNLFFQELTMHVEKKRYAKYRKYLKKLLRKILRSMNQSIFSFLIPIRSRNYIKQHFARILLLNLACPSPKHE